MLPNYVRSLFNQLGTTTVIRIWVYFHVVLYKYTILYNTFIDAINRNLLCNHQSRNYDFFLDRNVIKRQAIQKYLSVFSEGCYAT